MSLIETATASPEYNVTGIDYADRRHFRYQGPLIDIHAHVILTRASDPPGPPIGSSAPDASVEPAERMLRAADDFRIVHTMSMCLPENIPILRKRFGDRISFNGWISKQRNEPDDVAYQLLDRFLEQGVRVLKFWAAPRGRPWGLTVDASWRIEVLRRAAAAGIRTIMVHVGDPDVLFRSAYADASIFGTKPEQYTPLVRLMEQFPKFTWIAAHMGGDPENPEHLQGLLERHHNLYFDTSGTKWQIREISARAPAIRALVCQFPDRFLFGSDLVTRFHLCQMHYTSRYWCQRTLWESDWEGPSPIADADYIEAGGAQTPQIRGLSLPLDVIEQVYFKNAARLLNSIGVRA